MYDVLNRIIKEEVDRNQKIAIYPMGKVGMYAREILNVRYGREALMIDNKMCVYNPAIMDIEHFKEKDAKNITVLVCTERPELNLELMKGLEDLNLKATIVNVLVPFVVEREGKEEYFKKFKHLCRVKKAKGYPMVRVGDMNDGGYVMLKDFSRSSIAYSFGIATDITWDEEMAEKGMKVYCYDPSISYLPKWNPGLHFESVGIAGEDMIEKRYLTLSTLLRKNGHENERNMILKMDVEGAEWDFIESTPSNVLDQFLSISFELHNVTESRQKVIKCLEKLCETHQPVWVHANNVCGGEMSGDIVIPQLLEITYVNKGQYQFEDVEYSAPILLDAPNVSPFFDMILTGWGTR